MKTVLSKKEVYKIFKKLYLMIGDRPFNFSDNWDNDGVVGVGLNAIFREHRDICFGYYIEDYEIAHLDGDRYKWSEKFLEEILEF